MATGPVGAWSLPDRGKGSLCANVNAGCWAKWAEGAVQAWHNNMLAQIGMSRHRVSQHSPCMDRAAPRAPLLNAPRARAKVSRVIQSDLRIAVI